MNTENQNPMIASMEAEQSVIGGVLLDNTAFARVGDLPAEAFYAVPHRMIWQAVRDMMAAQKPVDLVSLESELQQRGGIAGMNVFSLLVDIHQATPSAANIAAYANVVRQRHANRLMFDAGNRIAELGFEAGGRDLAERQEEAMRLLTAAVKNQAVCKTTSYAQAILQGLKKLDQVMSLPSGALLGFSTGLHALDVATQGLRRGDLTVIGGRPSMGKSALAENIARHIARQGFAVRYQSYEMSASDLGMRGLSADKGVSYSDLRSGRGLVESDWVLMNEYMLESSDWRLDISNDILTVGQIAAECRLAKQQGGLDLLVVDHLHLIKRPCKNTVQELDEISATLKQLAMELDIHVILLAQLSRAVEQRTDKRPMMSDLRESGGIEQNANVVLMPFRPAYYDESENPTKAELIIAKNRDGERGTLHIGWQGEYQRFTNHADESAQGKSLQQKVEQEFAC